MLGAAAALAIAGCGGSSTTLSSRHSGGASFYTGGAPGGTPVRGGRIVIDQSEQVTTLDPLTSEVTGNNDINQQFVEGLVELPTGSKEVKPALATSWTINPQATIYTFHIREGVKFSNGEPLTGEDVLYSLDRQKLPIAVFGSFISPVVKQVSLRGPMTVEIQLKHPDRAWLQDLAFSSYGIVSKHAVEREGEKTFERHPVGTGPFMVKSSTPTFTTITLVRNPHYWRTGQPYANELVWNQVTEANARMLAVRSGSATIDLNLPFSQVAPLRSTPGVRVLIEPYSSSSVAFFNDGAAPFNEVDVRKALNYATPREAIIKAVYKGLGMPANDFPTNEFKYYDSSVPGYPYDLTKARELLKQSKVPTGFTASITVFAGDNDSALIASILQSSWAKIGVHLTIDSAEPTTAASNFTSGKYQILLLTPEAIVPENYVPDLDTFYYAGLPGTGSYYKDPRVTALVEKATSTPSEALRGRLFGEIQRIANWEDAAFLPIAFVPQISLVGNSLRGFVYPPNSYFHIREAWLAP